MKKLYLDLENEQLGPKHVGLGMWVDDIVGAATLPLGDGIHPLNRVRN